MMSCSLEDKGQVHLYTHPSKHPNRKLNVVIETEKKKPVSWDLSQHRVEDLKTLHVAFDLQELSETFYNKECDNLLFCGKEASEMDFRKGGKRLESNWYFCGIIRVMDDQKNRIQNSARFLK